MGGGGVRFRFKFVTLKITCIGESQENSAHRLAENHLQPWPLSTVPARGYGDNYHQEATALDWAHFAQGWQLHHQSCNPPDPRGKVEAWSIEDNLVKNCGSRDQEHEPQLGHHPEAGQWQTGAEELRCCPIHWLAWWVVMTSSSDPLFLVCFVKKNHPFYFFNCANSLHVSKVCVYLSHLFHICQCSKELPVVFYLNSPLISNCHKGSFQWAALHVNQN